MPISLILISPKRGILAIEGHCVIQPTAVSIRTCKGFSLLQEAKYDADTSFV